MSAGPSRRLARRSDVEPAARGAVKFTSGNLASRTVGTCLNRNEYRARALPLTSHRVLFLPGASGAREFWQPVAERLPGDWEKRLLNWPGAGNQAPDPLVHGAEDLVKRVTEQLDSPADIVAQSMGGVVALGLAVARPHTVRRLVLVATSGGVDVRGLGGVDWRADYRRAFPQADASISGQQRDLTREIRRVLQPTLLIWGSDDPISPPRVGEHLAELLPNATLRVIRGGHNVAYDRPEAITALIQAHLG